MKNLLIINGATKGLGLEIVKLFIENKNFKILCIVRDLNNLSELSLFKDKIEIYKCDYSSTNDASSSIEYFNQLFQLNFNNIYFINNISTVNPIGCIGSLDNEQIVESVNINIISNIIIINNILNNANKSKVSTYILNISSGISTNPTAGISLYGIAKQYLDYTTKIINVENSYKKIKAATFYPGGIDTGMQKTLVNNLKHLASLNEFNYEKIYNQKLSSAEEIAEIIYDNYILSDIGWEKIMSNIYDYTEKK